MIRNGVRARCQLFYTVCSGQLREHVTFRFDSSFFHIALIVLLCGPVLAQQSNTPQQEQARRAKGNTCLEPPPMVRWQDYDGPFAKLVGIVGGKIDRTSIHVPHYKPGTMLCSLGAKDKFVLFVQDSIAPFTLLSDAFNAGVDQAENFPRSFGGGMKGYGRRVGADAASDTSTRFFSEFLFPTIFSEDPRYYRLGRGAEGTDCCTRWDTR